MAASSSSSTPAPTIEELQREYGDSVAAVEPGGAEPFPLDDRHGRPYRGAERVAHVGPVPRAFPEIGDVTLLVGFVLAFTLYAALRPRTTARA